MPRPQRAATQKKIDYAAAPDSDEEEEKQIEGNESGDQEFLSSQGGSVELDDQDVVDSEDAEEFVPKKKARVADTKGKGKGKATGKVQGRAGKLQSMVDLPVDVWFMIAEHLDPPSLLSMGRANKMMRSLFASKEKSQGLWNIVKRSVGCPALKSTDINDLQLMSLIYDRDCHRCGTGRAVIVDYYVRKRWCKMCRSASLVIENRLRGLVSHLTEYTLECCLSTGHGLTRYTYADYYLLEEVVSINAKILEYKQAVENAEGKKQKKEAEGSFAKYLARRKAIVSGASSDAGKLENWARQSLRERVATNDAARKARLHAIERKLRELGYEEQDLYFGDVDNLVDRPTVLTPTIWNKISDRVIAAVEGNKGRRLAREAVDRAEPRRQAIKPYYNALREASEAPKLFPLFDLFTSMPAVQVFWKEEDSSIDEGSWHASLERIQDQLPKVYRWIKLEFARNLLKAHETAGHPLSDDIRLAIHPPKPGVDRSFEYYHREADSQHDIALDIDDPSTISPSNLDALISCFTAAFQDSRQLFDQWEHLDWKEYYELFQPTFVEGLKASVNTKWLKTQIDVLKQTELEDNPETNEKLQELGPKFSCYNCHDNLHFPASVLTPVKPEKTTGLTWNEMVQHTVEHHWREYHYNYALTLRILYEDRRPGSTVEPKAGARDLQGAQEGER